MYPKFKNKEECAYPEREVCNYTDTIKRCPYIQKILWLISLIVVMYLTIYHSLFAILLMLVSIYFGATARGKNWLSGWKEVKEVKRKK